MTTSLICMMIPSALALIFAVRLLLPSRTDTQKFLGQFLLMTAVAMSYLFILRIPGHLGPLKDWIVTSITILCPSVFYRYICRLTGKYDRRAMGWFLYPPLAIIIANMLLYLAMGFEGAEEYFNFVTNGGHLTTTNPVLYWSKRIIGSYVYRTYTLLIVIVCAFITRRMLKGYHNSLQEAITDDSDKASIDNRIVLSIMAYAAAALLFMGVPYTSNNVPTSYYIGILVMCLGIHFTGFYGLHQKYSADSLRKMLDGGCGVENDAAAQGNDGEPANSGETSDSARSRLTVPASLYAKLQEQIDSCFYLEQGVTIVSLSERMATNRTYLSKAIHDKYGCSFSDFVNGLRVNHAIRLIRESDGKCLMKTVAMEAGFQSASSMNHNFIKFKHMSPSEWVERFIQHT